MEKWRKESLNLWKAVVTKFEMDAESKEILRTACYCLTRFLDAEDILSNDGCYVKSGESLRKHPAVEVSKISHAGFLSAMRRLNLDWDGSTEYRPYAGPGRPTMYNRKA
jgi:hypothetical protein